LSVETIYTDIDKFAQFGLPIHITEFDVPMGGAIVSPTGAKFGVMDEERQAEYLRIYYRILFSHPSVTGINYWNIYKAWMRGGELLRNDLSEKPIYKAMQDLLKNEWKTRLSDSSDKSGTVTFKGFHGKYVIYAQDKNGNDKTWNIHVKKGERNNFRLSF